MSRVLQRLVVAVSARVTRMLDASAEAELRARLGHVGAGCTLASGIRVSGAEHVCLGDNVHIGRGAWIKGEGGLTIGSNTHISRNLVLYTINHDYEGERLPYDENVVAKPVTIGENVWIGMNVCVAPGTTIGEGAIVGMGTTVSGMVEPLAIVGSQGVRVLGQRDPVHYERLRSSGAFGGPNGVPLEP